MSFPDSKISRFVRRVIMVSTFVLFFVTAPIVILYTAGYRYNFSSGKIERTGVISLEAVPAGSQFFINDKLVGNKSPLRIPNMTPGSYRISIRSEGYRSFDKDIIVRSQQTTYIKNLSLLAEKLPEKYPLDLRLISEMKVSPTGKYIMIVTENEIKKNILLLINTETGAKQTLREFGDAEEIKYSWSPYADFIAIESRKNQRETISVLAADNPVSIRTETFPKPIEYLWGTSDSSPELIIKNADQISLLTVFGVTEVSTTTAIAWFMDASGKLWTASADKVLAQNDPDNARAYSLPSEPTGIISIDKKKAIVKVINGVVIIKFSEGEPVIRSIANVSGCFFNIYRGEWLIWTDSELWSVYSDGVATILNRTGEKILSVRSLDKHGVLLISTPKGLFAYNPGYYFTQELASVNEVQEAGVDIKNKKIFFLGQTGDEKNLHRLDF